MILFIDKKMACECTAPSLVHSNAQKQPQTHLWLKWMALTREEHPIFQGRNYGYTY